ncbi:hypothetical protein PFISCL1PPCAC_24527, partial [Pristionchus fissidentatus]
SFSPPSSSFLSSSPQDSIQLPEYEPDFLGLSPIRMDISVSIESPFVFFFLPLIVSIKICMLLNRFRHFPHINWGWREIDGVEIFFIAETIFDSIYTILCMILIFLMLFLSLRLHLNKKEVGSTGIATASITVMLAGFFLLTRNAPSPISPSSNSTAIRMGS